MAQTAHLLRDLVALPSVNPMGRPLSGPEIYEHRVTDYLEAFFRTLGVSWERQPIAPLRDNILARYEPAHASATVIFEAHQDTVPADNMHIDPFAAYIDKGRLYGRGACDVKGGMAAMLAAFARLVREQPRGGARVLMACTVDEEFTFLGVQRLAESALSTPGIPMLGAIVAEPTQLKIVNAHKGAVRWHLTTRGRSCHSSRPDQGVNAIYRMAMLLPLIERFAEELRSSRTDARLGPATLSVGRIDGGTSVNTVPDCCRIEIDRRLLPGENSSVVADDLAIFLRRHLGEDVNFEYSKPWLSAPALGAAGSDDLVARLGDAVDAVVGAHEVITVPYGTDAATLSEVGIPAVVFGPGDITQAHTCDEWIELEQVEWAAEILYRLASGQ